jgi:hypothetical protein
VDRVKSSDLCDEGKEIYLNALELAVKNDGVCLADVELIASGYTDSCFEKFLTDKELDAFWNVMKRICNADDDHGEFELPHTPDHSFGNACVTKYAICDAEDEFWEFVEWLRKEVKKS